MRHVLALLVIFSMGALRSYHGEENPLPVFADDAALLKVLEPRLTKTIRTPDGRDHERVSVTPDRRWLQYSSIENHYLVSLEPRRKPIVLKNLDGSRAYLVAAAPDSSWVALMSFHARTATEQLSIWRVNETAGSAEQFASYLLDGEQMTISSVDATRFVLSTTKSSKVIAVDAKAGKIATADLELPQGHVLASTRFSERPLLVNEVDKMIITRLASLEESEGKYRLVAGNEILRSIQRTGNLVLSADGRRSHGVDPFTSVIYETGARSKRIGITGTSIGAGFTHDSRRLVSVTQSGTIRIYDALTPDKENDKPLTVLLPPLRRAAFAFLDSTGTQMVVIDDRCDAQFVPLVTQEPFLATVCGQPFKWEPPSRAPEARSWPVIELTHKFVFGDSDHSSLEYEVCNTGSAKAFMLEINLEAQWDVNDKALLHRGLIGTLAPGESRRRKIELSERTMKKTGATLTLSGREAYGFEPPRQQWLFLPRRAQTPSEYENVAKQVFESGVECIKELRKLREYAPILDMSNESGFRCFGRERATIRCQTLQWLSAEGMRENRELMQVSTAEELMRHGEMFLYWFIPLQLCRTLESPGSWSEEYAVNALQPFLTQSILAKLKDAPYSAWFMARVYERYERALGLLTEQEDERAIELYLKSAGVVPPLAESLVTLYFANSRSFSYIGLRVSRASLAKYASAREVLDNVFK